MSKHPEYWPVMVRRDQLTRAVCGVASVQVTVDRGAYEQARADLLAELETEPGGIQVDADPADVDRDQLPPVPDHRLPLDVPAHLVHLPVVAVHVTSWTHDTIRRLTMMPDATVAETALAAAESFGIHADGDAWELRLDGDAIPDDDLVREWSSAELELVSAGSDYA